MNVLCFLWAYFLMPHCRSSAGKWKHTLRSWGRGFLPIPPPLPPPLISGDANAAMVLPNPSRPLFKEVVAAPQHYVFDEDDGNDIVGEQELGFLYEDCFEDLIRAHADSGADADCVPVFSLLARFRSILRSLYIFILRGWWLTLWPWVWFGVFCC